MTDVKQMEISQSQPQQQQQQQPQQQQMMIVTHEMQQQNVQQQQQQHVQQQQQQVQQQHQVQQQVQQQQNQQVQQQQVQQQVQQQQQQVQQQQQMQVQQQQVQQQVQQQQQMQVQQQVQQQQQNQQQQQQANGQHNVVPTQVQVQPQVAAIMPQQQQQQQAVSMTLSGQQGGTTITTMAAHPQAVQVIQQPLQSQAYHLQQLYNTQGTPLIMPGNLALHPAGINPSSIQVITAGKPFQTGTQLTPHMLTTASNPGQGGGHPGTQGAKVQGFLTGYLPVPTSTNPGGGQTVVFGHHGVLGSPQPPSMQQQQQQQSNNKQDQVQKYTTCTAGTQSGGRGGSMQFAPWQFAPQVAWAGLQPQTLLTAAPNQIFIRGPTQQDMYIQSPQPIQAHNALATQQQIQGMQQIANAGGKPRVMDIQQQQQQQGKQSSVGQRPLSILPSSLQGVQGANIRPASSVSTQTVHGVQTTSKGGGGAGKGRGKPVVRTSPGPNATTATSKTDAANQTKSNVHHATMIMQQQPAVSNSSNNNKILITTNTSVATSAQPPGSPMSTVDKQNFGTQNKTVMQSPQQPQQQLQQMQQQHQQVFIQQMQHIQQQQLQQQYQQQQSSQQQIQPKPMMAGMALQQQQQQQQQHQQQNVVLGGERPIMPVVSMGGVGVTTLQMNQVQQSPMATVQQLQLPQTINTAMMTNQLVNGGTQVQTMSMVAQSAEQPQQQAPQQQDNSQMMVTTPERNQQDSSILISQLNAPVPGDDASKSTPKKNDASVTEETSTAMDTSEADQSKPSSKEDCDNSVTKVDDKMSNNPLANLASAVNSFTNGIIGSEEPPAPISLPMNVNSKQAPLKAMVKPQVLTHVIEGFVIQEASEPFAINRSSMNGSLSQETNASRNNDKDGYEEPPKKKHASNYPNDENAENMPTGKCETCGKQLDDQKFKKDKRFCSSICAKSKKREIREREAGEKQWTEMEIDAKNSEMDAMKKNGEDKSLTTSTTPNLDDSIPKINPVKWTVNEVCDFIRNLPGCADYAEDFAIQEIDGQALMLLKEDHLMSAMSIKLGPALKIVARIDSMRIDSMSSTSPVSSNNV